MEGDLEMYDTSRQAAIDTVAEYEKQLCEILGDENGLVEIVKILKHRFIALPSAQLPIWGLPVSTDRPLADEEVVSRLRDIQKQVGGSYAIDRAIEVIEAVQALPSAQPDNSCDGCRYENADDGVLVPCGFCKRSYSDNYERRTDEQTVSE